MNSGLATLAVAPATTGASSTHAWLEFDTVSLALTTKEDGRFSFGDVRPGPYRIVASPPSARQLSGSASLPRQIGGGISAPS